MLGNSWVAPQLAVFQEGLSSMKLAIIFTAVIVVSAVVVEVF
jgi:hypothetical protein